MSVPESAVPPRRLLLGPGPSPVHPRVLEAQARPVVGHLDPWFLARTDEVVDMLRQVLRTANRPTFAVSGTGSAGMEAAVVVHAEARWRRHREVGGGLGELAGRSLGVGLLGEGATGDNVDALLAGLDAFAG